MTVHPIESESYRRLRAAVATSHLPPLVRAVVERIVHASGDTGYVDDVDADEEALRRGVEALVAGAPVVADVRMVAAGLTGVDVHCGLDEPEAAARSEAHGITRSAAGLRLALERAGAGAVVVVGCAPTALRELLRDPTPEPALVVGLPVGFVDAVESKAALRAHRLASVTNHGPKGGSAVAAAACNALVRAAKGARR